jgi:PAS domain S-box-containing protein
VKEHQNPYGFLEDGGRIGRRIGKLDWSNHPLGPLTGWDPALCTSLGIVLSSALPTFLIWGEGLTLFFNDAYEPMLGYKAHSLGSPLSAVWHELWEALGPYVRRVLAGESFLFENYATALERYGYTEEAWFTFSCSPLRDAAGAVHGMLCTRIEVTDKMRALARYEEAAKEDARLALPALALYSLPAPAGEVVALAEVLDSNEARIRQSSEAIMRQVRHLTALADSVPGLPRLTPGARPERAPEE